MRFLLLIALIAGLAVYIVQQRATNYPMQGIVTPGGRSFKAMMLKPQCDALPICIKRIVWLTAIADTVAIKEEAKEILAYMDKKEPSTGPDALGITALVPGFLQIAPPKAAFALLYLKRTPEMNWQYSGMEDRTAEFKQLLGGQ